MRLITSPPEEIILPSGRSRIGPVFVELRIELSSARQNPQRKDDSRSNFNRPRRLMNRQPEMKEYLPTSPMKLACPTCGAKPGHDCETPSKGRLYVIHLARVKAAALMDKDGKKA